MTGRGNADIHWAPPRSDGDRRRTKKYEIIIEDHTNNITIINKQTGQIVIRVKVPDGRRTKMMHKAEQLIQLLEEMA